MTTKYGDEVASIVEKGITKRVIDPSKVEPEKLAQYVKGLGKDPLDSTLGEEELLKMFKAPSQITKSGSELVNDVVVTKVEDYLVT